MIEARVLYCVSNISFDFGYNALVKNPFRGLLFNIL